MPHYYLSFCDPERPKGQKFLGATVIEAPSPLEIVAVATRLGRNPGGGIAFVDMTAQGYTPESVPPHTHKYFERFVPREEVLADGASPMAPDDGEDISGGVICDKHNQGGSP